MVERFTYEQEMLQELQAHSTVRFRLWVLTLGQFWAFGLHSAVCFGDLADALGALIISGMVALFETVLGRSEARTRILANQSLEYDGAHLRQVASDGTVLGEVDLNCPFAVAEANLGVGEPIYRVIQKPAQEAPQVLEFSARICDRHRLVRNILHQEG